VDLSNAQPERTDEFTNGASPTKKFGEIKLRAKRLKNRVSNSKIDPIRPAPAALSRIMQLPGKNNFAINFYRSFMSTANIIDISGVSEVPRVIQVTFSTHGGGIAVYEYRGEDARAIENGSDPANYHGVRVA
jgi:hypothetical protein